MKKKDIEVGNVIETRRGLRYLKCNNGKYYRLDGDGDFGIDNSTETLESLFSRGNDIVKVYENYTLKEILWERKEKTKLTENERAILRNIDKKYKWIARDESGALYLYYNDKPSKKGIIGKKNKKTWANNGDFRSFKLFNHLFNFITWEDEEPYLISDLLKN